MGVVKHLALDLLVRRFDLGVEAKRGSVLQDDLEVSNVLRLVKH